MVQTGHTTFCIFSFLLLIILPYTQAFTFISKPNITTTVTGRPLFFCESNGLQWSSGLVRFADNCIEIRCEGGRMHGAGYGIKAGKIGLPDGCFLFKDGCNPLPWTLLNGTKVTCFYHKLIPGMNV